MWIREEGPNDPDAIHDLVIAAFAGVPGEGRLEARIVDTLRADHALAVSLVADIDGRIAGHVAFSPARPSRADSAIRATNCGEALSEAASNADCGSTVRSPSR